MYKVYEITEETPEGCHTKYSPMRIFFYYKAAINFAKRQSCPTGIIDTDDGSEYFVWTEKGKS
jgi:hypothetical protein